MPPTSRPSRETPQGAGATPYRGDHDSGDQALTSERLHYLKEEVSAGSAALRELAALDFDSSAVSTPSAGAATDELRIYLRKLLPEIQGNLLPVSQKWAVPLSDPDSPARSWTAIAQNMEQSIHALGPALAQIETPVSPQLARSAAATETAWRELEAEFGLLSSREVSKLVGSKSPNRSYASEQHSKGRLIAVKRPGGFRYPGFQIDREGHTIRPVISDLIHLAKVAGRSEASLALWMTSPTGYLDGDRPVDRFSQPDKLVEAAEQSFNVQW